MAAIVRLGSFAGKRSVNTLLWSKCLSIVGRSVSTCRIRLLADCRLGGYGLRLLPFR